MCLYGQLILLHPPTKIPVLNDQPFYFLNCTHDIIQIGQNNTACCKKRYTCILLPNVIIIRGTFKIFGLHFRVESGEDIVITATLRRKKKTNNKVEEKSSKHGFRTLKTDEGNETFLAISLIIFFFYKFFYNFLYFFIIICLPLEFLPVSGWLTRWCASTLGTALLCSTRVGQFPAI